MRESEYQKMLKIMRAEYEMEKRQNKEIDEKTAMQMKLLDSEHLRK